MKPAAFDYIRADSAQETVSLLAQYGEDAKILAGGQSLMAMLNIRLAQPKMLVDISRCKDLDYARIEQGKLAVGAAATQASRRGRSSPSSTPTQPTGVPAGSAPSARTSATLLPQPPGADSSTTPPRLSASVSRRSSVERPTRPARGSGRRILVTGKVTLERTSAAHMAAEFSCRSA